MCGIFALLGTQPPSFIYDDNKQLKQLLDLIDRRGPDFSSQIQSLNTKCLLPLHLKASVLHLRGEQMQKQPVTDSLSGNALLFNGQIYEFNSQCLDSTKSDTTFLFEKLESCQTKAEIAETFALINGPFAFIYWSEQFSTIFYGRDLFGRKSLCVLKRHAESIPVAISSVTLKFKDDSSQVWSEVDCIGFYSIDFSSGISSPKQTIYTWQLDKIYPITKKCNIIKEEENFHYIPIKTVPLKPLDDNLKLWQDFSVDEHEKAMNGLEEKLLAAIERRIKYNRKCCLNCRKVSNDGKQCEHSKIAIAFSGGIDSTFIALLLDEVLDKNETIDLSTVAFKNDSPDRNSVVSAYKELRKLRPKRNWRLIICDIEKSKLQKEREETIRHLISPCNTVIDDSLGCGCWFISRARGRAIDSLLENDIFEQIFETFAHYNISFDDNFNESVKLDYKSPATMFFAGMSIDEQLGGYSSHRAAWSKVKTQGVFEEVSFQMRRLSSRNLGRDDRAFSHHGRDVKLPYLDQELVSFINQLPVGLKMNLAESQEIGPKKLLRELAFKWGLKETSKRVKRALQFGTRIANLEDPKEQGNDVCVRLN